MTNSILSLGPLLGVATGAGAMGALCIGGILCFFIGFRLISNGLDCVSSFGIAQVFFALPMFILGGLLILYGSNIAPSLFWWI
jgi:hypothetical protein